MEDFRGWYPESLDIVEQPLVAGWSFSSSICISMRVAVNAATGSEERMFVWSRKKGHEINAGAHDAVKLDEETGQELSKVGMGPEQVAGRVESALREAYFCPQNIAVSGNGHVSHKLPEGILSDGVPARIMRPVAED